MQYQLANGLHTEELKVFNYWKSAESYIYFLSIEKSFNNVATSTMKKYFQIIERGLKVRPSKTLIGQWIN